MASSVIGSCTIFAYTFCMTLCIGLKIGSWNTYQSPFTEIADETKPHQLTELAASDFDVLCLQELMDPTAASEYHQSLIETYPHQFSEANLFDFDNLPRSPCSSEQTDIFLSDCIMDNCGYLWPQGVLFGGCMTQMCPEDAFPLLHTECFYCTLYCENLEGCPTDTVESALNYCSQPLPFPIDLIDGTMILSKYPLVNTYHYDIPSWFQVKRAVIVAEIDVSDLTESNSKSKKLSSSSSDGEDKNDGMDTVIVSCLHLSPADFRNYEFFPASDEQIAAGISSFAELNAFQSEYILEHILNGQHVEMSDNNVVGQFVAGDFNVGDALYPENIDIWLDAGYIYGRDVEGILPGDNIDDGCTWCGDVDGDELPNALAVEICEIYGCEVEDSDIDHVLVYDGKSDENEEDEGKGKGKGGGGKGCEDLLGVSYEREFTNTFDIDGRELPLSDHWGVSLEVEFGKQK